jgi:hypothetical protein
MSDILSPSYLDLSVELAEKLCNDLVAVNGFSDPLTSIIMMDIIRDARNVKNRIDELNRALSTEED